jgi:phosphate butyryltransferase
MIRNFKDLENQRLDGKSVAVVWPSDANTIKAVLKANKDAGISPIFVGEKASIMAEVELQGETAAHFAYETASTPEEAARRAVELVRNEKSDAIMKGKVDTAVLLKAVVNKESGIRTGGVMSHFVVHELEGYSKLLAMSDGGMNLYPDLNTKKEILKNAVSALHGLGIESPMVAVLAAVEKVNPKMPETVDAQALKEMNQKGEIKDCYVEGPISYDLTMSKKSAEIKGYESPVTENTDLLLVPNITVGNILGKSLVYTSGAKMAGVVVGAKAPIILTSRGSSFEEKYYSILLAGAISG